MSDKVYKIRLQKGDTVVVLAGKDKGKTGVVEATHPKENKVTVKGINMFKKTVKADKKNPAGGIIDITKPIWVSKVALQEPTSKKPTKIGYKLSKDGGKVRIYKRTNKEVK
ncbi:MAG: 50S ribosomal protein L24 [Patescibacteria group bacterium]